MTAQSGKPGTERGVGDTRFTGAANSDTTPAVNNIPAGYIQFIDNFIPTLDPGQYIVSATQTLAPDPAGTGNVPSDFPPPAFTTTLTVTVGGAGLALAPTDIYSVYPPDKSEADYTQVLPHIVLSTRTVPWEVQLDTAAASVPWMALLIFADGEIVKTQTLPLSQAQVPPAKTVPPKVPAGEAQNTSASVTVIDLKPDVFLSVMPKLSEVPYLAHCRQLNVADKETGLSTGWFATLIANRLPSVPVGKHTAHYTAHLVSLYGLDAYLAATPAPFPTGTTAVRLISLSSWTFTCDAATGLDFRALMTNLAVPPAGTPKGDSSYLLLRLPTPPTPAKDPAQLAAQKVLQSGYVPVPYHTRQGDAVSAWYRGPLCPAPTTRLPLDPITFSGQAMIYDKASGMFDQSYAVAWETGRLLALSDRNFATNLIEWRSRGQHLLNQLHFNIQQNPALRGTMQKAANNPNVQELRSLLEPDVLATDTFLPYVVGTFAKSIGLNVPTLPTVPLPPSAAPPNPPVAATISAGLTALTKQAWVQNAVGALTKDHLDLIAKWLGRICLFYGVPFNNLVPDGRMLPAESIRFFYVDQTYLDAMVDGAISVGVHSSRDTEYNAMMHGILRDAVDAVIATLRAELLGVPPTPQGPPGSMAGFILRSAAVSGWPGLEVKGYQPAATKGATGTPMPALRIDRVAPDVLFALFPAVPGRVELNEPHEGLRFGVEDENAIELRTVSTDPSKPTGTEIGQHATAQFRAARQVLNVDATRADIGNKAASLASVGPAGFAVQMVKSPEQMVFYGASA